MNTETNNNLLSHSNEVKVAVKEIKEVYTRETSINTNQVLGTLICGTYKN